MKIRILMLVVLATSLLLGVMPGVSAQETTATESGGPTVVVLVDMSGSLSPTALEKEIKAALVLGSLDNIDLYVIGFASEGTKPAWEAFCEPGDDLATCTENIERRTDEEGNDTDHAAALAAAAFVLTKPGSPAGEPRIVLMMTDGRFDPEGEGFSDSDLDRLEDARSRLQDARAEVWPLGFGNASQEDLDRLALSGPNSCEEPRGVIVDHPDEVLVAFTDAFANATCSPALDGSELEVPPGTPSVTIWYTDPDLPEGEITITPQTGDAVAIECRLDELTGLRTCLVPTDEIGTGTWNVDPAPELRPYLEPPPPPEPSTPTTLVTTPPEATPTTTPGTTPTTVVTQADAGEQGGFPWWILLVLAGLAGAAALVYALTRPKLPRGYVAVRKGDGDWSPEETVRSERRQTFEVDVDGQYPSIMRTADGAPDVTLEATREGVCLSGSMIPAKSLIRLGDELELDEGIVLTYVTSFDDESDDYDYHDESDDFGYSLV